jgi:ribonuclease-3
MTPFQTLEKKLGYRFSDQDLLRNALTHKSAPVTTGNPALSYQRLEFLGDRVLGLIIADALFDMFPDAEEGELAKRYNRLVRAETCQAVADELQLGACAILGESEARSGGRKKKSLLADLCESLLAALYLDGGYDVAKTFVLRFWQEHLNNWDESLRDPKTTLQEWAHQQGYDSPLYETLAREGPDHAPVFTIAVHVGPHAPVRATGASKRDAQQKAASLFLEHVRSFPVL